MPRFKRLKRGMTGSEPTVRVATLGPLDTAYVFTRDGQQPINPENLTNRFKERCGVTFHSLLKAVGKEGAKGAADRIRALEGDYHASDLSNGV
jgi:hypothetical protein